MIKPFILLTTALLSSTLISTYSWSNEGNISDVEEIKITATRTPISQDSATTLVTIISKEDLEKQQIFQVSDYLKIMPGVALASSGSLGSLTQLRMRGAEANQTMVMIDGVEMNDPAAGDEFQFEHLTINEIERIEIIRSPMSASWGSDALSGVINIITRDGKGPRAISGFLEYGSLDTFRGGGGASFSGDGWTLATGVSHMKSDGNNVSRVGDETDGYKNTNVNSRASLNLSENLQATASFRYTDTETSFDGTDWLTGLPADSDNMSGTNKSSLSIGFTNDAFEGRLVSNFRMTLLDTMIINFVSNVETRSTSAFKLGVYFDNQIAIRQGHTITLAIDHEKTDFSQSGAASIYGDPNQTQKMTNTGYLADYVGEVSDHFTLSGSLRHDVNSNFDNILSWRVGVSYKVSNQTRIFASGSKGQKAPTFLERYGFFSDQFSGNPDVKPEKSVGYEIGIEHNTGTLNISLVYFNTDLTNEIDGFSFDLDTFLFTAVNKIGKSKRKGFEVTVEGEINDYAGYNANYSYIDATEDDGLGNQIQELRRPRHMGSLGLFINPIETLNISMNLHHTGKSNDLFFPPYSMPSERVDLESYNLLRATLAYNISDDLSLYGRVENALDENYENVFGFSTPNRMVYFGLKGNF